MIKQGFLIGLESFTPISSIFPRNFLYPYTQATNAILNKRAVNVLYTKQIYNDQM